MRFEMRWMPDFLCGWTTGVSSVASFDFHGILIGFDASDPACCCSGREWRVISDDYAMSQENGGSTDVDSETVDYIQRLLKERSEYKKNRDFDAADEIRDDLRDNYGVSIDDRTREWSVKKISEYSVVGDDEPPRERRFRMPLPDGISVDDDDNDELEGDDGYSSEAEVSGDDSLADTNYDSEVDEDLSGLTVPELKERLREAGLPVSGRKSELIERLSLAK